MKPGRNDLCPCGSGKKYKNCCMEKDRVLPGETSFDLLMYAEEWILGQPEFEKEFDIAIPDDQAENIGTVGDAIAYIEKNGNK